ncbi:MAG TPA: SMI1/KNR4 family protein [Burkholderiaceae bacterium]|jgi:hypothetical protein
MSYDDNTISIGHRLRQFWLQDGGPLLQPPVADHEVLVFEVDNNVCIPLNFLEYLKCANGFNQYSGYQDKRGFNFWPLQEISPLAGYDDGRYDFKNGSSKYFLFCDYLDFSWGYAISMDATDHRVVLVGTKDGEPRVVSESFEAFADAYLNDSSDIYL